MFKIPFIKQEKLSKYKVIEVEAENLRLSKELIEQQKGQIKSLNEQVAFLKGLLREDRNIPDINPYDAGASLNIPRRPHYRTMSEVQIALEERSRTAALQGGKVKSAEDIIADDSES